jgi:hypothetical protein
MRRLAVPLALLFALAPGCGGGGGDGGGGGVIPPAAATLDAQMKTGMTKLAPLVSNVETSLLFMFNPGTPMAQGVVVQPGAAPNSVTFSGPYDGNGDGINETTVSGSATFRSDPSIDWTGLDGQVTIDVSIPVVGHVYHGDITFTITSSERRLAGSGTFSNPLTGNTTTLTVPAGAPLVIKPSTGAVSNACGYSIDGQAQLAVTGAAGTLRSTWIFASANASVAVNGATFTDPSGQSTAIGDSSVDLRCGGNGRIEDWVATFDQQWACLPRESGSATITIAANGPSSVTITDEDPPGSGSRNTYAATIVGASPHAVRGFFLGGAAGNQYREDFTWTLGKNASGFSDVSTYVYQQGPKAGKGGICVASARRR